MTARILVLPGDGIGPEVTGAAVRVLRQVTEEAGVELALTTRAFGGASLDAHGVPATDEVLAEACAADAVLLGAVGGPAWDEVDRALRPERGLLALRAAMGVFANLRPARCFDGLAADSPLRPELTEGVDLVVVRELVGGIYFGEPRHLDADAGSDTMVYTAAEVRRIGRVAFELARKRSGRVLSVDKANVLASSALWRREMTALAAEFPDVELSHQYVDSAAMTMVTDPGSFDVIVTGNLFGDILSDQAAALTGSLGMLPSAALGGGRALYEPVHGSAPDIAGQGIANPLAAILSAAMLCRHTLGRKDLAVRIEDAVDAVVASGLRTPDLARAGEDTVGTERMTAAVLARLARREAAA